MRQTLPEDFDHMRQALTPGRTPDLEYGLDAGTIEEGIGGPPGRRLERGRRDRLEQRRPSACVGVVADDLFGKSIPRRVAPGGEVEGAEGSCARSVVKELSGNAHDSSRDIACRRRCAMLIGDHADFLALARKPQYRLHKILPVGGINPRRAQYDMARLLRSYGRFARGFAFAIRVDRNDRIVLPIAAGCRAIEYVVGGEVDEGAAVPDAGCCQ